MTVFGNLMVAIMVSYALSLYLRAQEANNELNLNNGIRDDALTTLNLNKQHINFKYAATNSSDPELSNSDQASLV